MPLFWSLLAVPLLIGLNAFFVISEYAVVATGPGQIERLRGRGKHRAAGAMERLKADATSAIGAIQVCITMVNLLLGWIGEPAMSAVLALLFAPLIGAWPTLFTSISTALSFLIVTLLTVVFSELLPKAMTLRYVEQAALLTALPILAIKRAIFPLVWLMNAMANLVTRPLGLGKVDDTEAQQVTLDELKVMANQAAQAGVLTPREQCIIVNSLALSQRTARQIMVPRTRVVHLDLQWSMEENRRVMHGYLHSRLPLCDGGMDHVIGLVHTKEFLAAYNAEGESSVLSLLAQPPVFVPEQILLDKLLALFHERRTQMVFLVEERGGVEGIVTLQDVVDELFGSEVQGACPGGAAGPVKADGAKDRPAELVVAGDTPLHDLSQQIGQLPSPHPESITTIGGLIVEHASRIPASGEQFEIDGMRLRVIESDGRAVRRVQILTLRRA